MNTPLVTIAVPTYNRSHSLRKTLECAINQTYKNIEILVHDNASTDSTSELLAQFCRIDPRICHHRNSQNLGAMANYLACLDKAKGRFFLWLADDDFISSDYVEKGVSFLLSHKEYVLVGGVCVPHPPSSLIDFKSVTGDFNSQNPATRCLDYYKAVLPSVNGLFYGISELEILKSLNYPKCVGNDLLWTCQLVLLGKVKVLDDAFWHFSAGGASQNLSGIAKVMRLSRLAICFPALNFATSTASYIIFSKFFSSKIPFPSRLIIAMRLSIMILCTHVVSLKKVRNRYMDTKFKVLTGIKRLLQQKS